MSSLFGGARARASEPSIPVPEAALRLTTSVQGKARPIAWGRNRIGLNVIWLGGFQPYLVANWTPTTATQTGGKGSRGGGGGGGTISYAWNYLVNGLFSISEGPIISIVAINNNNTWTTGSMLGGGSGGGLPSGNDITAADLLSDKANLPVITDIAQLGLFGGPLTYGTLYRGTQTQNPSPNVVAKFPDQALAYRGEAYIALEPLLLGASASLPQMSVDVVFGHLCGLTQFPYEAYAGDVIVDYLTNPEYGVPGYTTDLIETPTEYNLYTGANSLLVSPVITDQVEGSSFINDLLQATHSAIFMSGGKLRIRPYAEADASDNGLTFVHNATPIYDLAPEDFLPGANTGFPVEINRKQPQDMATNLRIEYLRRSNGYAPTVVETRDEATIAAYGLERQSDVRTQHFFTLEDCASKSAGLQLQREQVTTTYTFNLPREFELLDPMDLLTLPLDKLGMGQARQAIRITEIVENDDYTFTITAEEYLGTADLPIYKRQATVHNFPEFNLPAGDINPPLIFELPTVISNGLNVFAALSGGDEWGGCEIWASFDGTHYMFIERMLGATRMGYTTNSINAVGGPGYVDFSSTLGVNFTESRGALESASVDDMISGATAIYTESGEILSYTLANLGTSAYHYDLTPLMRGVYGTPVIPHSTGELVCRVDGSIVAIPYDETKTGRLIYLKFLSFNKYGGGGQGLSDVTAYTYRIKGEALEPIDDYPGLLDGAAIQDFVDAVDSHNESHSVGLLVGETSAAVTAVSTVVTTTTQALASLKTTVTAKFSGYDTAAINTAATIQTIQTGLANATGSIASLTSTVTANYNAYTAFVASTTTALASAAGTTASLTTVVAAQGTRLDGHDTRLDGTDTSIGNLNTTTSNLGTVTTSLGVSVTANTTAINDINGTMAARYSLELNVSGRVTGFYLFADQSGRSDFAVQADKFQIWATGYANKPVFEVDTIGGTADLVINGRHLGDLSVLTDGVNNNAITNSTASSGAGNSGIASLTVRTGSRILVTAYYEGGGISFFSGASLQLTMDSTSVVSAALIPNANNGTVFAYYGVMLMYVTTAGSSGTRTAQAILSQSMSGNVTVYMQEMKK